MDRTRGMDMSSLREIENTQLGIKLKKEEEDDDDFIYQQLDYILKDYYQNMK